MKITSFNFFIFTIFTLILYYVLPKKCQWMVLLCSSLAFFYISCNKLIFFVCLSSLIAYVCGLTINKYREEFKSKKDNLDLENKKTLKKQIKNKEKTILVISIVLIIGMLVYLKYINFIGETINNISSANIMPVIKIILPIGISYYSLMLVSYIVDVYRGLIQYESNYFKLLLYACYFPHIVEGPFNTYKDFSSQINEKHFFNFDKFIDCVCYFLIGLIKKLVIADRFSFLSNEVFNNYPNYYGLSIILGMVSYALCLYFDFSGCIDIVRAISRTFGIEMTKNFDKPFFSTSVQEFWRRWHISFGNWLKNYVFYPVSLSKVQKTITNKIKLNDNYVNSIIQSILPLLCVWLTMGIWHGADWKYVLYGLYYFLIIFMGMLFEPLFIKFFEITKINRNGKMWKTYQSLRTLLLVIIGLSLFRADTFNVFIDLLKRTTVPSFDISILISKYCDDLYIYDLLLAFVLSFVFILYEAYEDKLNAKIIKIMNNKNLRCAYIVVSILFVVLFGIYGTGYTEQPSVYAEF